MCEKVGKIPLFCPKIVRFMKVLNFWQWKGGCELQEFSGFECKMIKWRYGYVEEKFIVYTS